MMTDDSGNLAWRTKLNRLYLFTVRVIDEMVTGSVGYTLYFMKKPVIIKVYKVYSQQVIAFIKVNYCQIK